MNNQQVNKTMRQVASYAFDYVYALTNVMSNQGTRLHGIIPSGMKTYNASIPFVSTNLTKARTLMITSGMVPGVSLPANNSLLTQDSFWTGKAQLPTTAFAKFNYTYNADNQIRSDMGVLLRDSLALVGIYLSTAGITWKQFVRMMYDVPPYNRNQLQFFFVGWGPDYNDPEDYVSPLFSNVSASNSALVNDPKLQGYIDAGRSTTNDTLRTQIYWNLQNYTQNELMPWMFVYQGHNLDVWVANLKGYYPNALDWHYFGLCYFEASTTPPGEQVPIPIGPLLTITFGSVVLLAVFEFKRLKRRA
jgi:oligopeptide transport system substrate-binding protein